MGSHAVQADDGCADCHGRNGIALNPGNAVGGIINQWKQAQDLASGLGKVVRINPDGSIPKDNPFVGKPNTRPEIYSHGWRNPWRWSFDRKTGQLWAGDVGQGTVLQ